MSSDEFWRGDPQLFVSYRTSFLNKKKREKEELDYKCWLQGLYNYDGNGRIIKSLKQLISNIVASFTKSPKDMQKIESYPKLPYSQLYKQKEEEKEKNTYDNYKNSLIVQGSIKQIYLNKMMKKSKGE